jgi:hypothetical protein
MDISEIVTHLTAERDRLDQAIAALEGSSPRRGRPPKSARRKRTMSADARRRIGLAMKLAWAKRRAKSAPKRAAAPAKKAPVRRPMSPAGRKKLAALMKARWAARKKSGANAL